jgi:hypothetical protein
LAGSVRQGNLSWNCSSINREAARAGLTLNPAFKNARLDEQAAASGSMDDKLARTLGTTLSGMFSELDRGRETSDEG